MPKHRAEPILIRSRDLRFPHETPYDIRFRMKGQIGYADARIENIEFRRIRGANGLAMDVVEAIGVTIFDKYGASSYHLFHWKEWDEEVEATWKRR